MFGIPKQLRSFQVTIPSVKIICAWIGLHYICQQLGISTLGNNLQVQRCWIGPFTKSSPFQPWHVINNLHGGSNVIINYRFVYASHLVDGFLKPLVVHRLCKVTCWHSCTFIYYHIMWITYKLQWAIHMSKMFKINNI